MSKEFEAELYEKGFHFFSGYTFTPRLTEFLFNEDNYPKYDANDSVASQKFTDMEIPDKDMIEDLFDGLPSDMKKIAEYQDIYWTSRMTYKGFVMEPHNDEYSHNPEIRTGIGNFVLWLCPPDLEGREFVWGNIIDPSKLPKLYNKSNNTIAYNKYPNFNVLGRVKPATGLGVIPSKRNPMFWHGVDKQLSSSPMVVVRGTMWDK